MKSSNSSIHDYELWLIMDKELPPEIFTFKLTFDPKLLHFYLIDPYFLILDLGYEFLSNASLYLIIFLLLESLLLFANSFHSNSKFVTFY